MSYKTFTMSFLPTATYYYYLLQDEYRMIINYRCDVQKRLRDTLVKEFEESEHGREFVKNLFELRPVAGTVSVMYSLQNPIDVSDIIDDDVYNKSGLGRLFITMGCWKVIPTTEDKQIKEVLMKLSFGDPVYFI